MQRKSIFHSKKFWLGSTAVIVAAATTLGSIYFDGGEVNAAKVSLPGVETIVMNNNNINPFVIYEVVPSKSDAIVGYFIKDEEPINDNAISIREIPYMNETDRANVLANIKPVPASVSNTVNYSAFELADNGANEAVQQGSFQQVGSGEGDYSYTGDVVTELYVPYNTSVEEERVNFKSEIDNNSMAAYMRFVTFTPDFAPENATQIAFALGKADDNTNAANIPISVAPEAIGNEENCYNNQYFTRFDVVMDTADSDGTELKANTILFLSNADMSTLTYYGVVSSAGYIIDADTATAEGKARVSIKRADGSELTGDDVLTEFESQGNASQYFCSVREATSLDNADYVIIQNTVISNVVYSPYQYRVSIEKVYDPSDQTLNSESVYERITTDGRTYYILKQDVTEYTYVGAGNGNYIFKPDFSVNKIDSFRYNGGFNNKEWFKRHVFDLEDGELNKAVIEVKTITPSELSDVALTEADLIYFAGGAYTEDIAEPIAYTINNMVADNNFPVIVEYSTYTANKDNAALLQISKLAAALMQDSIAKYDDVAWNGKSLTDLNNGIKITTGADNSFVNGTVFVNDDTATKVFDNSFMTTYSDDKISNGFMDVVNTIENTKFNLSVTGAGDEFNDKVSKATCIRHILNAENNKVTVKDNLRILDLEPYACDVYGWDNTNYQPTTAAMGRLKSVTNAGANGESTVDELTTDYFDKKWFLENMASQFKDTPDGVRVTMMGTAEFVGKRENLNESYDLIYIGADTTLMNTAIDTQSTKYTEVYYDRWGRRRERIVTQTTKTKTKNTVFNDGNMNGLVYMHVGDKRHYNDSSVASGSGRTSSTNDANARFSGNDITIDKYNDLKRYVEAGYALMLSDDLLSNFATGAINTSRVDVSSNMYDFLTKVCMAKNSDGTFKYYGKNVNYKGAFLNTTTNYTANRTTFAKYINIQGLIVNPISVPKEYVETNGAGTYLDMNSDGSYSLDYKVRLSNNAVVDISNTTYDCALYIDLDTDGKFESGEKQALDSTNISSADGGPVNFSVNDGKFALSAGYTYDISKRVPDGFVGFLSWKLVFTQNEKVTMESNSDDNSVRTAISGFSAVPAPNVVPEIKVLQLTSARGHSLNFDLTSPEMQSLYKSVKDFTLTIDKVPVDKYILKDTNYFSTGESYIDYLCEYNMVVLGFTDVYEFCADNVTSNATYMAAMMGIRDYALSGRSILFTHDLTNSFKIQNNYNQTSAYYFTMYLRDVMGMDRYGEIASSRRLEQQGYTNEYVSKYDDPAKRAIKGQLLSSLNNIDYTNFHLSRFGQADNSYGLLAKQYAYKDFSWSWKNGVTDITQVNRGQITEYPFKIEETFSVTQTHPQYYQLNLDTDSEDDVDANGNDYSDDDTVVWYTIGSPSGTQRDSSGQYFANVSAGELGGIQEFTRMIHNDVRNNYYIYNRGNITYTGSGHANVDQNEERQLFVNTLVASYNAGTHAPAVVYKESPVETAANITTMYLPFDRSIVNAEGTMTGGIVQEDGTITVDFKTINNNLKNNNKPLYADYYVEVSNKDSYDIKIGDKYLKKVTPVSFELVTTNAEGNQTYANNDPYILKNYQIYTMKVRIADLGLAYNTLNGINKNMVNVYVRLGTEQLATGSQKIQPSTESITPLAVYCAELFELE